MNERIKELRKSQKMTQEVFSSHIRLLRNFIAQIEIGTNEPSNRTIKDICRVYNVNEEWLRTGKGEMFNKCSRNQKLAAFANNIIEEGADSFKKKFILALSELNESDWETIKKMADVLSKED